MSKFVKGFERGKKKPASNARAKEDYPLNNQYSSAGALFSDMPDNPNEKKPQDSTFTPSGESPDHGG